MFGQWISTVFEDRDLIYEGAKCDTEVRQRNVLAAGFKAFTEQVLEVDFHSSALSVIITLVGQQLPSSPLILCVGVDESAKRPSADVGSVFGFLVRYHGRHWPPA